MTADHRRSDLNPHKFVVLCSGGPTSEMGGRGCVPLGRSRGEPVSLNFVADGGHPHPLC